MNLELLFSLRKSFVPLSIVKKTSESPLDDTSLYLIYIVVIIHRTRCVSDLPVNDLDLSLLLTKSHDDAANQHRLLSSGD